MIIKIPVKPHLRKYLIRKLQVRDNLINISTNDSIGFGIFILNIICKKNNYLLNFKRAHINKYMNQFNNESNINITIGPWYSIQSGIFINEDKIVYINKFIEKQFKNELNIFIHSNYLYNPRFVIEYGIEDFLSHYGISEDDIHKESIVKFFHRNKNQFSYSQ